MAQTPITASEPPLSDPVSVLRPDTPRTRLVPPPAPLRPRRLPGVAERSPASFGSMRSITPDSCGRRAAEHLDDAYQEYSVGAWASAEASAWKALELIATGLDVAAGENSAASSLPAAAVQLRDGRRALGEAREFVAAGAVIDAGRMDAIAASHQTPVLHGGVPSGYTAAEAVDRYLDYAREKLTPLAGRHVRAAQAMDLIAAVTLGRNEADQLPEETALCLRRAAFFGQPSNPSLASQLGKQLAAMGLGGEAERTLRHALSLEASAETARALAAVMNQRGERAAAARLVERLNARPPEANRPPRTPEVIELSPSEFAAISPPLNTGSVAGFRTPSPADAKHPPPRESAAETTRGSAASGSAMKRWINKFRNLW